MINEQKMLEDLRRENDISFVKVKEGAVVMRQHQGKAQVKTIAGGKIEVIVSRGETKTFKKEFVEQISRKTSNEK